MSRQFTDYVSSIEKKHLSTLSDHETSTQAYSNALFQLGHQLGNILAKQITPENNSICVACTVEDADYLAKGIIDSLSHLSIDISLACFWNHRDQTLSIAPIIRKYHEPLVNSAKTLVIVKSVISGACVVKTNLTNLIQDMKPERIFVVSPVMHTESKEKLNKEFPKSISDKFKYIYFAIDSKRENDGNLIPGIGGNVYQRLGFKDQEEKNRFTPNLVKERRNLLSSLEVSNVTAQI